MIRKFVPADLDAVVELWLDSNLDAHPFLPERYWRENAEMVRSALPQSELYLWEEQGKILGFVGLQDNYLAGIFVAKKARGEGIGKALLDCCKERHAKLQLHVYQKNEGAYRFYLREGFSLLEQALEEESGEQEYFLGWNRAD